VPQTLVICDSFQSHPGRRPEAHPAATGSRRTSMRSARRELA
jgi:hypothetical protein